MSITGRYLRVSWDVIATVQRRPEVLVEVICPEPESDDYHARTCDIDKTWHIIHFLLNGDAWGGEGALFDAILGGAALTDEDLGFGCARFLTPAEVVKTAKSLCEIPPEELWARFDEAAVVEADLYWSIEPEGREYVLDNYAALRAFFGIAAKEGQATILWLA